MGDKGILLTVTEEGGGLLPSPSGSVFISVQSNTDGTYSITGNLNGSSCLLMDGEVTFIPSTPALLAVKIYSSGTLCFNGSSAANIVLNASSCNSMHVSSGGTVDYITLDSGGQVIVSSGGAGSHITVNQGGRFFISDLGTANHITLNTSGYLLVHAGGTANSITINSKGSAYVSSSGKISGTTVNSLGYLYVSYGGIADESLINSGGQLFIAEMGSANHTTISHGGRVNIAGIASGMTVKGGNIIVSQMGSALGMDWTPGVGKITISDGGYVTYTSQYSGVYYGIEDTFVSRYTSVAGKTLTSGHSMCVIDGGIADSTTLSGGHLYVLSGGTAAFTMVRSDSDLHVSYGGIVNSTTVGLRGVLNVSNGGTADTVATGMGGVKVYPGGSAKLVTVNSSGYLTISSGGGAQVLSRSLPVGNYMYQREDPHWESLLPRKQSYRSIQAGTLNISNQGVEI